MIKVVRGCLGEEVKEAFSYGYFGLAYKAEQFEKALQEYLGVRKEVTANKTDFSGDLKPSSSL